MGGAGPDQQVNWGRLELETGGLEGLETGRRHNGIVAGGWLAHWPGHAAASRSAGAQDTWPVPGLSY